jgi:AAA family ATP:ADP antiporter
VQAALAAVLVFAALAAALHTKIHATARRPAHPADLPPPPHKTASQHKGQQRAAHAHTGSTDAPAGAAAGADDNSSSQSSIYQGDGSTGSGSNDSSKKPTRLLESAKVLAASLEIRCLAVMTLGHGLCTSLMELCWKHHMRLLLPSPSEFTAFLGDVAVATGGTTALLMLLSPLFFERLGWRGVASATPQILLYGGTAFFAACLAYQCWFGGAATAATAGAGAGHALLTAVVLGGALLYVFSKGAKFSLFKPAEEMVYITLDEDGRTRGKAAIDVVGSQAGKSGGSILQQALLLASAGALSGPTLPLMWSVYWAMLRAWNASVHELSSRRRYTITSPLATPLTSLDESDGGSSGNSSSRDDGGGDGSGTAWGASSANGKTIVAAPPRPAEIGSGLPPSAAERPPGGGDGGGGS